MATVSEQITVTITGPNAQTLNYNVLVDTTTGNAVSNPLSISYVGNNSGTDVVKATMPSHSLTSNQADVAWQAVNGLIAVGPITIKCYDQTTTEFGANFPAIYPNSPGLTTTSNSLIFNQVLENDPINGFSANTNVGVGGGYKVIPMVALQQTAAGQWASNTVISDQTTYTGGNTPGFLLDCRGNLVVKTAGEYTFYMTYANAGIYAFYVGGGAVRTYSNGNNGGSPAWPGSGPGTGYTFMDAQSVGGGGHPNSNTLYITFPKAGIYPFQALYNQVWAIQFSDDNNGFFQITYLPGAQTTSVGQFFGSATQWLPVSIIATPPTSTPSGDLQLTPTGGAVAVNVQGQTDTLSLSITGVPYTTIPYVPVLEGTTGQLPLYDSSGSPVFNFGGVTYPPVGGSVPDFASAIASGAVALSGDNTAWQGVFSISPYPSSSPTALSLSYNGGALPNHIDVTNLTITADDIAWFDNTTKNYDLYTVSSSGGGLQYPIQVAYMVKPSSGSFTTVPLTAVGDNGNHTFTVTLTKPMSPEQQGLYGTGNTVTATASATAGVTVIQQPTPILDSSGWLTGWTMVLKIPHSTTNGSFQLSMNITGVLTYLNGTVFVNSGAVTYFNGVVATVTTTGFNYTPPTNYAFTVAADGSSGTLSGSNPYTFTGTLSLSATVFATDSGTMSVQFYYIKGTTKTNIGSAVTAGAPAAVSGGYHSTATSLFTTSYALGTPISFGYTVTDTLTTLTGSYTSSNTYNNGNAAPPPVTCFSAKVGVKTPFGFVPFDQLPLDEYFQIVNNSGTFEAELVIHDDFAGEVVDIGYDYDAEKYVTLDHLMETAPGIWEDAVLKYSSKPIVNYIGKMYTLHVHTDNWDDQHFIIDNGDVAHNKTAICFSPNTKVKTKRGDIAIEDIIPYQDQVLTARGTWKIVEYVTIRGWDGPMFDMGDGELSTLTHYVKHEEAWKPMDEADYGFSAVDYKGTIHNLHLSCDADDDGTALDTEHSYTLANGLIVHNITTVA